MILLHELSGAGKFMETGSRSWLPGAGVEGWRGTAKGYGASRSDEDALELQSGGGCTSLEYTKIYE